MSPTLFKVFVETSLNEWSRKCSSMRIQIKNNLYLRVILAQDTEDADYMCQKLIEEYHHWGLKINVSETEYFQQILMMTYILIDTKLKKVNNFYYLGSILEQNGTSNLEIEKQINNGMKVLGC
jgi:hypothetical protein